MNKVKDVVLYQVATDRNYKVGDIIEFGKNYNGNGNRVYNSSFNNGNNSYHKECFSYINSKKIFKDKTLLVNVAKSLEESDFVLRELAAEEIRKEKYNGYPSRLKCMFLSEKKEDALKNLKIMYQKGYGNHFQAVSVKLNGNIFYARNIGLKRNGLSYNEYLKIADEYWKQDQNSTEDVKEILFEGIAEIVEVIEEYKIRS